MEQFFIWLSSNSIAANVFIISFVALVIFIITIYGTAFFRGQEISFGPAKISAKPGNPESRMQSQNNLQKMSIRSYFDEPLLISATKNNQRKIPSDFIFWERCTLMLWVLVSPKEEGLRNAPSNRYLLAHHTGRADEKDYTYFNQFCFRYSNSNKWQVTFSNNKAQYPANGLKILDGLAPGWHHFLIAWDRSKPKLALLIDIGNSGSDINTSSFSSWPEKLADNVTVGACASDYAGHYCETKLYNLMIFDDYLETTNSVVKEHFSLKPSI